MQNKWLIVLIGIFLLPLMSCSLAQKVSNYGIAGASIGGVAAGLIGNHIGGDRGKPELGAVIGASTGAIAGLAVGEHLEKKRVNKIQNSRPPKRVPVFKEDPLQSKINKTRLEQDRKTKLGAGETKPWNERYIDDESGGPYQGPIN